MIHYCIFHRTGTLAKLDDVNFKLLRSDLVVVTEQRYRILKIVWNLFTRINHLLGGVMTLRSEWYKEYLKITLPQLEGRLIELKREYKIVLDDPEAVSRQLAAEKIAEMLNNARSNFAKSIDRETLDNDRKLLGL